MSKKQKIDEYLKEAIDNIREDRDVTKELLDDIVQFLAKGESTHRDVGLTAAKYVETLQRSNEQLVKISGLLLKSATTEAEVSLSDMDKDEIYDLIKES
ncbi:MAG: hypothetical protein VX206_03475 [Pseudomonadota bacterium]|nr:hypothetical protein [Pseudomonadota bacterium]